MRFHVIGRHRWIAGATITESTDEDGWTRRFTATIRGYRNWKIYQGPAVNPQFVADAVRRIRNRIDDGDETIFAEPNEYTTGQEDQLTDDETAAYADMEAACVNNELLNFSIINATVAEAATHDGAIIDIGIDDCPGLVDLVNEIDANRRYKRAELAAWARWQEQEQAG